MTERVYKWFKLFLENKRVTIVLLIALFPSLAGNLYGLLDIPVKPVEVAEKPPEAVIEEVTKPVAEIVIHKPHTHSEIVEMIKDHEKGPLH
jgi:hypothetical protein